MQEEKAKLAEAQDLSNKINRCLESIDQRRHDAKMALSGLDADLRKTLASIELGEASETGAKALKARIQDNQERLSDMEMAEQGLKNRKAIITAQIGELQKKIARLEAGTQFEHIKKKATETIKYASDFDPQTEHDIYAFGTLAGKEEEATGFIRRMKNLPKSAWVAG